MRRSESGKSGNGLRAILLVSTLALLSGCDWFDGTPTHVEKLRPGAERALSPSDALPPPPANQQYGAPDVAVDENRGGPAIGSIIAASGGQKAQIDKQEKEQAERDKADREAREKTAEMKTADKSAGPGSAAGGKPGEPPAQPVAIPRNAVTGAPIPPPPGEPLPTNVNSPEQNPPPPEPPAAPNTPTKPAG